MPRVLDFTRGNETDWNEVRLPAPVYGEGEITEDEFSAIAHALGGPLTGFEPQFSTYAMADPADRAVSMDAAHAWLSANATGPWSWMEHWTNHGHHIDVAVYVERIPDREAFARAHPDLFKYRPAGDFALGGLAVARGALPRLTALESFGRWCRENAGFELLPADDLGENGYRISFTHAGLEREFLDRWGDDFVREEREGGHVHVGSMRSSSWRDSPGVWLGANAAVGNVSGGNGPGGYLYKVTARFDDVADSLARDWGHAFERDEGGRTFSSGEYPSSPPREIPEDFMAYLRGEADSYDAPHLPEGLGDMVPARPSPMP